MRTIAFIGLGVMGKPMAANLLRRGYSVTVYNRTVGKAAELIQLGADQAATPVQAARGADVVITMLADDDALLSTFYGENGIMPAIRPDMIVIDCSTVAPETSRRLHSDIASHFADFLDAPVTGSKPAAESGDLLFMVGGSKDVMNQCRPLFDAMGKAALYMGQTGSGSAAKLAHNTIVAANMVGLVEGMSIAAKAGLDVEQFLKVVQAGGAASRMADMKGGKIINRDFSTQFSMNLMLKDLRLASNLSTGYDLPSPLLKLVTSLMQIGTSKGIGDQDISAIAQCYEDWMQTEMSVKPAVDASPTPEQPAEQPAAASGRDRRKQTRISMNIALHLSVYEWEQEGAFSGQLIEGTLADLSESGLQIISDFPLSLDMFVVIHFPQEADLPPIIGRIIRIEPDRTGFRYGCMLSGLPLYIRLKLEEYIKLKSPGSSR